jgi:ferredoxin-thioredoxin reductase catalytic subunit
MTPQELYDRMKKVQEPKGYYFNTDNERTFELLEALIANKENYGYMGCCMFHKNGMRVKSRTNMCPSAVPRKKCLIDKPNPLNRLSSRWRTQSIHPQ